MFMKTPFFLTVITVLIATSCNFSQSKENSSIYKNDDSIKIEIDSFLIKNTIINQTYLGNEKRNYYGDIAPDTLQIIWKLALGTGQTRVGSKILTWSGAGWTGQPLIVKEDSLTYLIQGTYTHNLLKIREKDAKIIWAKDFGDVIKGTGTIFYNKNAEDENNKLVILQGSRQGFNTSFRQNIITSYRAISYFTGKELWSLNSKLTESYSRDVDGSSLIINDTAYIGLENAIFTVFNPNPKFSSLKDGIIQPKVYEEHSLYEENDIKLHGGNLVTESSPSHLLNHIYITSGSGHVYGYNLKTRKIDWSFFTGSDMDGSPTVTDDNCILISLEKQYIPGPGGVFKLDPSQSSDSCVKWFFPVQSIHFAFWDGGIIGSVSVNDSYRKNDDEIPNLAAFSAIDGNLYVVNTKKITGKKVIGPDNKTLYDTPELVFKYKITESISTPIIVGNKIIAASYSGIYLFEFDKNLNFKLISHIDIGSTEATPIVNNGRIYVATKTGYLYCLGRK